MIAATHNSAPMIGLLMDAGADPALKNQQGQTATEVAERNGNLEAAQAILVLSSGRSAAAPAPAEEGAGPTTSQ
jgi:ankyrin repeat protein